MQQLQQLQALLLQHIANEASSSNTSTTTSGGSTAGTGSADSADSVGGGASGGESQIPTTSKSDGTQTTHALQVSTLSYAWSLFCVTNQNFDFHTSLIGNCMPVHDLDICIALQLTAAIYNYHAILL